MTRRPMAGVLLALAVAACSDEPASSTDGGKADQRSGVLGRASQTVSFSHKDQPFQGFKYDTGWQPSGSDIQIRLFATAATLMQASEPGSAELVRTIEGLDLAYVGKSGAGQFEMNLGVQLSCRLKIDVSVYGVPVKWEGDIPLLVPQWDYRFADKKSFTPFVLEGASTRPIHLADTIKGKELYRVPLPGLSIPSVGGGTVIIKAAGALNADLSGQKVSTAIVGGSTLSHTKDGQTVTWPAGSRTTEEADAKYAANVKYSGSIVLSPTISVVALSKSFDVAEFPINIDLSRFGQLNYTWDFNPQHLTFQVP
jgi:hypothetical protein